MPGHDGLATLATPSGLRTCPNCMRYNMFETSPSPFQGQLGCSNCAWVLTSKDVPSRRTEAGGAGEINSNERARQLHAWSHPPMHATREGWMREARHRAAKAARSLCTPPPRGDDSLTGKSIEDIRRVLMQAQAQEAAALLLKLEERGLSYDEDKLRRALDLPRDRPATECIRALPRQWGV
jgi:hypothetical protein